MLPATPADPSVSMDPLCDALERMTAGEEVPLTLERDDGLCIALRARSYLAGPPFPEEEEAALRLARGRICDAGAGAGRHALALSALGYDVTAIDVCPRLVALCRLRGVSDARCADLLSVPPPGGPYDTILLLDNGLGIAGTIASLPSLLERLRLSLRPSGALLVTSADLAESDEAVHRSYLESGRRLGRAPGEQRVRLVGSTAGAWFEWLQIGPEALKEAAASAGLRCELVARRAGGSFAARLVVE